MDQVLATIDATLAAGDLGRAFSSYLFLLQSDPRCKDHIRDDFATVLRQWADQLEAGGNREEALWCYEISRRLWPENAEVHNSMGAFLYRLGQPEKAVSCFQFALEIDPGYTNARKNLTNVVSSPFKGWHFPMLNDKTRNSGYQTAITKAVAQGHDTVLDIGSGTGLLSMFAVKAGAKSVFACEESKEMAELSRDVLAANQMQDRIQLLHKLSTDMSVPDDIPNRVSLVVTEIFDAGLFGEGVIGTLQHAWEHLLLPRKLSDSQVAGSYGRVIPARAVVYAQVVQCVHVRKQYRLLNDEICNLDVRHLRNRQRMSSSGGQGPLRGCQKEPYTSERLQEVPLGYQALTPALKVLEVDFNDPEIIKAEHPTSDWKLVNFPVIWEGQADAIISWFDLLLDDKERLSSSPASGSCWEQAIFPVNLNNSGAAESVGNVDEDLFVKKLDAVTVAVSCQDDCLHLKCAKITHHASSKMESSSSMIAGLSHEEAMEEMVTSFKRNVGTGQTPSDSSENRCKDNLDGDICGAVSPGDSCLNMSDLCDMLNPDTVAILNDHKFTSAYHNAIKTLISEIRQPESYDGTICDSGNSSERKPQNLVSEQETSSPAEKSTNSSHQFSSQKFSVLDISGGAPLAGLFAAKYTPTSVCIPNAQSDIRTLTEAVARANGIEGCVDYEPEPHPLSPSAEARWDVLVTDLVAPCGTLRERVLEDIAVGRVCALRPMGRVIPATVSVFAMCIECDSLRRDSEVLGTETTMGLEIAEFINKHKVSTFLDIHLSARSYKQLSKPFLLFNLDLNEKPKPDSTDLPSFVNQSTTHEFEALADGRITAVPFWYDIGVDASNHVNTLDIETHWRQAAFLLEKELDIRKGDRVRVTAKLEDSSFLFEVGLK